MTQVTRAQFVAAIEAGIERAYLDPHQEEALLLVGQTAKVFGTNYRTGVGCPATLAGLSSDDAKVRCFAYGFDASLVAHGAWDVFLSQDDNVEVTP